MRRPGRPWTGPSPRQTWSSVAPRPYAAVRSPGHHVGADFYGGSCHLNNAACAAQHLVDRGGARVAIIDVDAHHGNGTQEVFWARGDVWFGSVHVDPGAGWFPHTVGLDHIPRR